MNCETVSNRLGAYLDGELGEQEAAEVGRHLEACPRCAAELEALRELDEALGELKGPMVPPDFARRVREKADAGSRPVPLFRTLPGRLRPMLSRAAAVLVAAAGLWMGLAAGHSAFREAPSPPSGEAEQFDLPADSLSAAPSGSVADLYLAFLQEGEWEGGEDAE